MPNSLKTETEDHPGPLGAVAILPPVEPPEDLFSAQPKAGNQSFLCTLGVSFIPLNFVYQRKSQVLIQENGELDSTS